PDACYLVWAPCKIAEPAITGEGEVVLTAPPKPGHKITLSPDTDNEETHYVGAVTGAFTATLVDAAGSAATLANTHSRHTVARYAMPTWWERAAWDLSTGRVRYSGADLAWRDPGATAATSTLIEELTLGT
ncbi:MAG: hypothetical protein AAF170_04640, partial [Bacteroidota bacterium]